MMHYVLIIHRETGVLLFEKKLSNEFKELSSELISGLIIAIKNFSEMIKLGEASTFAAHNFKIVCASSENIYTSIIVDSIDNEEEIRSLAQKISNEFEKQYDITTRLGNISIFRDFTEKLHDIIRDWSWDKSFERTVNMEEDILGFLIYDSTEKKYWSFKSSENFNPRELLSRAKQLELSGALGVEMKHKRYTIYFDLYNSIGGAIAFGRVSERDKEKFKKTFSFIIKNFRNSFSFEDKLKEPAEKIFSKEVIKRVLDRNGYSIINILAEEEHPLEFMEYLRRMYLRNVVKLVK